MKFKDMKTTTKFVSAFIMGCCMSLVVCAIGAVGMFQMKSRDAEISKLSTQISQKYESSEANEITNLITQNSGTASFWTAALGIIALFGVPGAISVSLLIASSIKKNSSEMIAAAEEITRGNLDVEIKHLAQDEIGIIGQRLTVMSQTLKLYVRDISTQLNYMAEGDLTHEITQNYVGEFMPIKESLEKIRRSLSDTMESINQSASEVAHMANQVSSSAEMLSQGSTEQASAVEQLSAAIQEFLQK